jgi:PadR family transcriptional regulator PadR
MTLYWAGAQRIRRLLAANIGPAFPLPAICAEQISAAGSETTDSRHMSAAYVELGCVKLTGQLERVLRVFLADPAGRHHGYDLMKAARLSSGTLYPMLGRLEREGMLTAAWEPLSGDPSGRPPRKYYQLTAEGSRVARIELARAASAAPASRAPSRATTGAARPAGGSAR